MNYLVALFALASRFAVAEFSASSFPVCQERCLHKISSREVCKECCDRLVNSTNTVNSTATRGYVPAVPSPPRLVSHTYTTMTVQWLPWKQTDHENHAVLYVMEIKREQLVNEPLIILPYVQRYHVVSNTKFTSPILEGKTNYSMRVAAISMYGTQGFSSFSPGYQTNTTCSVHVLYNNVTSPCPVTNLRLRVTADLFIASFSVILKQRTASWLYWDPPLDIHVLPENKLEIEISPLSDSPICRKYGLSGRISRYVSKLSNQTRLNEYSYQRLMYMGCRYQVSVYRSNLMSKSVYSTNANFSIPECIQGICACTAIPARIRKPERLPDSDHVTVSSYQPISSNHTNVTVSWDDGPWGQKAVYFRAVLRLSFVMSMSWELNCEHPEQEAYFVNTTGIAAVRSTHNITFRRVTFKCQYYVLIQAYDSMACEISPQQKLMFDVELPTTKPSTTPSTPGNNASLFTEYSTMASPKGLVGEHHDKKNSAVIALAIVIPLVVILLIISLVMLFAYKRGQDKTTMCERSRLQRLSGDNPNDLESYVYHSNLEQHTTLLSDNLLVTLPPKCVNGGLEVNPAYVEQQIQEAIRLGETDDYEFGFHRLEIGRKLGKGAFGHVFIADAYGMNGMNGNPDKTVVAVKILKDKATEDEKDDFRAEINLMKMIGKHENVIRILGCCTLYEPLCLVVEYAPYGDLLHYLRDLRKKFEQEKRRCLTLQPTVPVIQMTQCRSLTTSPSISRSASLSNSIKKSLSISNLGQELRDIFSSQRRNSVSSWKETSSLYVGRNEDDNGASSSQTVETTVTGTFNRKRHSSNGSPFLSLDGALDSSELQSFAYQIARGMDYLSLKGVLHRDLAARNILVGECKVLKISDFGLSREGVYVKRSTGKIPLRWLSLEAMRDRIYSTPSDVWAFGIVLWEICTLGGFPYPTVNDRDLLKYLLDGNRMEKPSNCTDDIYQLMEACWSAEVNERPSFQILREILWDMQKSEHPYVNVDPSQEIVLPPDEGQVEVNLMSFSDNSSSIFQGIDITDKEVDEMDDNSEQNDVPLLQEFLDKQSEQDNRDNDLNENMTNNNHSASQSILLKNLNDPGFLQSDPSKVLDESSV